MEHQFSFADCEFTNKGYQPRKDKFLGRMDPLVPLQRLASVIRIRY